MTAGFDAIAADRLAPQVCPVCLLAPAEQVRVVDMSPWIPKGAMCGRGQCIILGLAWPTNGAGDPLVTIYPRWDNVQETASDVIE